MRLTQTVRFFFYNVNISLNTIICVVTCGDIVAFSLEEGSGVFVYSVMGCMPRRRRG